MSKSYDESSIKVLDDIEHIRLRPAMYISTDTPSLQMFEEIFSNAMDEVINGYATCIEVSVDYDKSEVWVKDNGRGIPQGINEKTGKPTVSLIYTKLNSGGKYDTESYSVSGGLHGVGSCVVNALSSEMSVVTYRDRSAVSVGFKEGVETTYQQSAVSSKTSGTKVHFKIDTDLDIFTDDHLRDHEEDIVRRLRLVSILYPKVEFFYQGLEVDVDGMSPGDLLPTDKSKVDILSTPILIQDKDTYLVLNWTDSLRGGVYESYCNMIHTKSGGDHVRAVEEAVTKTFGDLPSLLGMNMFISELHPSVSYSGQSKDRAKSQDMYQSVYDKVYQYLRNYLKDTEVKSKLISAFEEKSNKLASRSSRKVTKSDNKKAYLTSLESGGFADCTTKDRKQAELTLCEGLSAAGSLKQARNPLTQAVMPLRGKFINAYTSDMKAILANKEALTIISSIDAGILDEFDPKKSRYSKIIIFSDSDEDGKNIACQLIAFFAKIMPGVLTSGMLYLAIPPLYGTTLNGEFIPIHTEEDKEAHIRAGHYVQRYKGLGEMMPSQLKVTSLDPSTRRLIHIKVDETSLTTVERIMGGESSHRKSLLIEMGVFE